MTYDRKEMERRMWNDRVGTWAHPQIGCLGTPFHTAVLIEYYAAPACVPRWRRRLRSRRKTSVTVRCLRWTHRSSCRTFGERHPPSAP